MKTEKRNSVIYVAIAGPQSSGKSFAIAFLKKKFPRYRFYPEINPFTVSGGAHRGGAFATVSEEEHISAEVLARLRRIGTMRGVHVEETGPFHLVYAKHVGHRALFTKAPGRAKRILGKMSAGILFIDTPPGVSWKRRRPYYRTRVADLNPGEQKAAMSRYRKRIYAIYDDWLVVLRILPFPNVIVKNSKISRKKFLADTSRSFSVLVRCLKTGQKQGKN